MPNWRQSTQNTKGRVVLRGDIVKDDSGSYVVFTEQGSSASQMTAAKIMNGCYYQITRLWGTSSGCSICLYPGQNGRCSEIIENSRIGKSRHLVSSTTTQMAQIMGPVWKTQSFLLNEICTVILWQDCYGKGKFEKILLKYGWEKVSDWECLSVHREKGLFFSVYVDDIKLAGKKPNIKPMWNVLNKEVDLGEPTSFIDHVHLGCTQWQCEISKDIVDNYRTMFESRISAGAIEKLQCSENLSISSWCYDMEGHAKKCVERYCELANKTTQQLYKVSTPCIDDHHFKEENWKPWENCQNYALKLSSNAYTWHVLDDPIFDGQWTNLHDRSKNGPKLIISFDLLHSSHKWIQTRLTCGKQCGTVQIGTDSRLRFCRRSWGLKIHFRWNIMHFRKSYVLFQSAGCARNKLQFHTVNRIRNHFLGCRIKYGRYTRTWFVGSDRRSSSRNTHHNDQVRGDQCKSPTRKKIHGKMDDLDNVDFLSSNVQSSHQEPLLYVFEDNEAVIKMIIKGRSPTIRHVSRTHRVALDWLFDRIILDTKIQIKYIDTKNQLADILTKGNFTRDEWNHLLCVFNISHFSSINSLEAMSKRTHEDAGEERVTAKSKPMLNLVSRYRVKDPNVLASTASESPVKNTSESQNVPLSSSNVQRTSMGRPVLGASSSNYSEWNNDDKSSSQRVEIWWNVEHKYGETRIWQVCHRWWYGLHLTPPQNRTFHWDHDHSWTGWMIDCERCLDGSPDDSMQDIKRSMIWWMFMSSTLEASVFMGKTCSDNWHPIKNTEEISF